MLTPDWSQIILPCQKLNYRVEVAESKILSWILSYTFCAYIRYFI